MSIGLLDLSYRFLQPVGYFLSRTAGILRFEFEPIPLTWIVAGGDNGCAGGLMLQDVVAKYWGRRRFVCQIDFYTLRFAYCGDGLGELR